MRIISDIRNEQNRRVITCEEIILNQPPKGYTFESIGMVTAESIPLIRFASPDERPGTSEWAVAWKGLVVHVDTDKIGRTLVTSLDGVVKSELYGKWCLVWTGEVQEEKEEAAPPIEEDGLAIVKPLDLKKQMPLEEFVQKGYLQEANRRFFHPLGLALAVSVDDDTNTMALSHIVDNRDDPTGVIFSETSDDMREIRGMRAAFIDHEWKIRADARENILGYTIQPEEKL
jgi:hypothetical protein